MQKKYISVLLPVRNSQNYIGLAIESVLSQTFSDFELIIIDDFSHDQTQKIVKSFHDNRIILIENKYNLGIARSLNKGLTRCRGKYVARLDADDLAESTRFAKQVSILDSNPEITLVTSWATLIDEEGKLLSHSNWVFSPEALYFILNFRDCIAHPSVMFRRSVLEKTGDYPLISAEDYALWLKMMRFGIFYQIPEYLFSYRIHSQNVTKENKENIEQSALTIAAENLSKNFDLSVEQSLLCIKSFLLSVFGKENRLSSSEVEVVVKTLPIVIERIVAQSPAYLDKKLLQKYAIIEYWKLHYYFLNSYQRGLESNSFCQYYTERLQGYLYYKRHNGLLMINNFLPKDHF